MAATPAMTTAHPEKLTPAENHTFVSASLVKEIGRLGGDVSPFLHPLVYAALQEKFNS